MSEFNDDKLVGELVGKYGIDQVLAGLQSELGYAPNTYIPTIDEFIESDYYLGKVTDNGRGVYPYWREELREIFPNQLFINYDTLFFRSAIGTGKSSVARFVIAYILAKMILMEDPHKFYGLLPNKDLVIFLFSLTKSTIASAMYNPLVETLEDSPFFKENIDKTKKGLHFKNKIAIHTGSTIAKNVGKDIFLFWMDEIQIERMHNQNIENYNSLKARLKSRFMLEGNIFFNCIGILSGSPGGAEDMAEELTTKAKENIKAKVYSNSQWEILKGKLNYSGVTFPVFIGSDSSEPAVITSDKEKAIYEANEGIDKIIDVPEEYKSEFEDDIQIAIRDIAGISTRSTSSYFSNISKLVEAFILPAKIFNTEKIVLPFFDDTQISDYLLHPEVELLELLKNPEKSRYIHIDLGIVGDLSGIAMSHIGDYVKTSRYDTLKNKWTNTFEPWYLNDFAIGISRRKSEETSIKKILNFILWLRDHGVNIHKVTLDGYQSTQLKQELMFEGIDASIRSVAKDSGAYDIFKRAAYEGRCHLPKQNLALEEAKKLKSMMRNGKRKVFHPSTKTSGSHGDIIESICGSIRSAYENRESQINALSGFGNGYNHETLQAKANMANQENFENLIAGIS